MVLPERYSLATPSQASQGMPWAPNPKTLMLIRVVFTFLVCLMALASAIMTAIIINYYLSHQPMIFPPLSSMIFILFMGIFTSIMYFGYYIFLPSLKTMRRGSMLAVLFTMKLEVLFQFAMASIWISGALAYAADYRGHENCLWDGYYHYKKPDDWNHLCDMVNWLVGMSYATFGVQAGFLAFDVLMGAYIFMFLDQDSVSEPFYEWGTRAWEYKYKPSAPLSSIHNPMVYRSSPENHIHSTRGTSAPYGYNEKYLDGRAEQERFSDKWSESSSSHRSNRRGASYNGLSMSEHFTDESSTNGSGTKYYGGAYSRSSVNSRRADLAEAPRPAGTGGTSSGGAPSWHAPTITDADSIRSPTSLRDMSWKSRYVSAPSSLSTRGRRGSQYNNMLSKLGTIEDEAETQEMDEKYNLIDHKNVEEEEEEKEARRVRRRHSMDEDNPWLLEDDEMV